MAWASTAPLVGAVSNAGGLGVLGVGFAPPDFIREQIQQTRALTDRPFAVNLCIEPVSYTHLLPNFFVALVPLILVFLLYSVAKLDVAVALVVGNLSALILMGRYIDKKDGSRLKGCLLYTSRCV